MEPEPLFLGSYSGISHHLPKFHFPSPPPINFDPPEDIISTLFNYGPAPCIILAMFTSVVFAHTIISAGMFSKTMRCAMLISGASIGRESFLPEH